MAKSLGASADEAAIVAGLVAGKAARELGESAVDAADLAAVAFGASKKLVADVVVHAGVEAAITAGDDACTAGQAVRAELEKRGSNSQKAIEEEVQAADELMAVARKKRPPRPREEIEAELAVPCILAEAERLGLPCLAKT